MRRFTTLSLIVLMMGVGFVLAPRAYAKGDKMAYIDLARVFDEYQKTKSFDKTLEAKAAAKQSERDVMVGEVKKLRDAAELLSADAKAQKQAAIDEKIRQLQEFDRVTRDALRLERDTMVRGILKEIETTIQAFGKKEGYSFIFNDRVLVFKADEENVSEPIIKALNDSYAKAR